MLAQFRQFWTNLSTTAKAVYGGTAAVLLALVGGVGFWSSQTQYSVLLAKLPTEEAAAIVQKLDADRVSYKLSDDGTTILVPTEKVPKLRMSLASSGLLQGAGKGYELFDTMSMGATPFVQNMNFVRAIQGELARTIMQLEPVAQARVHIVQPEPTPFVREEKPVTASVVIKTKPGATLSRAATAGIVQLTAGSVKGLSAENVTVLDSDGRVLSEKRDPRGNMASNDQLSYQREVESHLAENAQEILTRLLGPGRAVVRVTAEMSFRHLKETSEKFDPEGAVVLRESITKSKTNAVPDARGATGAVSNIPPAPVPPVPAVVIPNKNDETTESEYAVSNVHRSQEEQQGVIDRLTVAVMLIPPKGADDDSEDVMGITPDEVRDLVKTAVGFKNDRDEIQVSIGKAPGEAPAEAKAVTDNAVADLPFGIGRDYVSVVRASSLGIAGLIALAMVVKLLRRRPKPVPPTVSPAYAGMNPNDVSADLTDLHAVAATIKAWLEEPSVIRFEKSSAANVPQAKPA